MPRPAATRPAAVGLVLLLSACGSSASPAAAPTCRPGPAGTPGPALLQTPPRDVTGPFYAARTDGPCGLFVAFTGAPEGDGPCNVAEHTGRLEPAGEDLRLVVEERHTGPAPSGDVFCTQQGAHRSLQVALDAPLAGRLVVDEQGHALHLVDGDRLLRPGALPEGWSEGEEGNNPGLPAHWSFDLRGPGLQAQLRQGDAALVRSVVEGPGYRRLESRRVRGRDGELGTYGELDHVLSWTEGDRGVVLQVLGPLRDADVLVEVADALEG